jgi:hypothetical protein
VSDAVIDPDQPMFLRVPVKCLTVILEALRAAGYEQEAKEAESFTRDYVDPKANADRLKWLERAEEQKQKYGEIEFDSDATISHSDDNGEYVLGWVWVEGSEAPEQTEGLCRTCGELCFIDEESGTSHHETDDGIIDFDADADHVAVLEDEQ